MLLFAHVWDVWWNSTVQEDKSILLDSDLKIEASQEDAADDDLIEDIVSWKILNLSGLVLHTWILCQPLRALMYSSPPLSDTYAKVPSAAWCASWVRAWIVL